MPRLTPPSYEDKIVHRLNLVLIFMWIGFLIDLAQKLFWK